MKDGKPEERWSTMMVQTMNFARQEQYLDAVSRARLVRKEIRAAIEAEKSPERHESLERYLLQVERQLASLQSSLSLWNAAIAALRDERLRDAAEDMEKRLPKGL